MYRSPPQPLNNDFYLSGDVTIEPNVAIATGVILQADPDSQIVIATGVCIGMGAIIHADQGKIEVEAGATIGAGVLVVGHGTIGAKACIGAETTLLNPAIAAKQVVPTGTIIGDESRSVTLEGGESSAIFQCDPAASQAAQEARSPFVNQCGLGGSPHEQLVKGFPDLKELPNTGEPTEGSPPVEQLANPKGHPQASDFKSRSEPTDVSSAKESRPRDGEGMTLSSPSDEDHDSAQEDLSSTEQRENLKSGENSEPSPEITSAPDSATMTSSQESSNLPATIVYGQVHLNDLLNTLLPHRKSLNNSNPPDPSPEKPVK